MLSRAFWQNVAFLILAIIVVLLCVDVMGFCGAGDPKRSKAPAVSQSMRNEWNALNKSSREYLKKEHETAVAEIRLRIEQEHLLFALKFALVGGILYAVQQGLSGRRLGVVRTPFAALVAWAAVIAAAIVDLRVMANQSFIVTLGGWVRQYEELKLGQNAVSFGWEAYLADHLLSRRYYPALRVSGQILTALLFGFNSAVFLVRRNSNNRPTTALVSGICAVISIVLMTVAGMSLRPDGGALILYSSLGVTAAALAWWLSRSSRKYYKEPPIQEQKEGAA